jgi:formylglycine-generating enzyme required for sulfatase activity
MNRFPFRLLLILSASAPLAFAPLPAKQRKGGEEKPVEIARGVQMVFGWIPAGTTTLGSPRDEKNRDNNEKEHEYSSKGFWLGKYSVTQEQWQAVMGTNPSHFNGKEDNKAKGMDTQFFPVERVSWNDCQDFIQKVNKHLGKGKVSLPHEDEWEYACRGGKGNKRPFYWGDSLNGKQANCVGTLLQYGTNAQGPYLDRTTRVGSYEKVAPHPWGLCDMAGDVLQWCDNLHTSHGTARALRGGSFCYIARFCRATASAAACSSAWTDLYYTLLSCHSVLSSTIERDCLHDGHGSIRSKRKDAGAAGWRRGAVLAVSRLRAGTAFRAMAGHALGKRSGS